MLGSMSEIASRATRQQQGIIKERNTPLIINDIHSAAQRAVIDATKIWYTWVRKELLQFDSTDTKEALRHLGILEEE